jgi:hypothetical protein
MLQFAAANPDASPLKARKLHPDNYFSAAVETEIEFVDGAEAKPGVLAKIRELFARKSITDESRFSDIEAALEEVAEHGEAQSAETARLFEQVDAELKASKQALTGLTSRLEALEHTFDATPASTATRPLATGSGEALTDF